ncbi:hypothetical protein AK812_SmicGene30163 [Symbiodinium microadriaticum]|uniref:Uncharacterized protein n=1 Tax=Symbiodinium microadriaticum TaxID=2951 RepID=A0A1Q9CZZ0_SYMMI|nr:hypothetical protein AK812_SmicGene30163 [Symbiodinium microadriaticum]
MPMEAEAEASCFPETNLAELLLHAALKSAPGREELKPGTFASDCLIIDYLVDLRVLFFSVFVLNIFIGVIGEQYSKEKDQAEQKNVD